MDAGATTRNLAMGTREWLLLLVLSLLWGGTFFFVEVALAELPPIAIVAARVAIAAVVLNAVVLATGRRMPCSPRRWRQFLVMGLLNNAIPFSLIVWGQTQITGGLAAILNAATPLFTVVLAHFLTTDERLTAGRLAGAAIGMSGVVAIVGVDATAGLGTGILGQVAVVAAALSYALAGTYGRRFQGLPPLVTAAGQLTGSAALMLPAALLLERPWDLALPSLETWAALAALALMSTALAYILYFRILAAAGAGNLLLVTLLIPATAILLGALFLGERLEPRQLGGMALIAFGLAAIDGRLPRYLATRFRR